MCSASDFGPTCCGVNIHGSTHLLHGSCVKWGSTNTGWHIDVHHVRNLYTQMCEVKHNGDMGMGHLWLIMGGLNPAKCALTVRVMKPARLQIGWQWRSHTRACPRDIPGKLWGRIVSRVPASHAVVR